MKVLVLGASGMLGNAVVRTLAENDALEVFGSVRSESAKGFFPQQIATRLVTGCDVEKYDDLLKIFRQTKPDLVINCVGLIKQVAAADHTMQAITINALLPHRLAALCEIASARLIHVSTDCVFSGKKGGYVEGDASDAEDVYGKSKFLGEVRYPHTITLRTSIIGHELQSAHGLIGWFLAQKDRCNGYSRAIFSGLPTVVLARFIRDIVIPKPDLSGLYHLAAQPISKYDLLCLVAEVYGKAIEILPDDHLVIDRSLNADKLRSETGYTAPDWRTLIQLMHSYK
jgi:dTDP-4-dehydrorhamnose reductase